MKIEVVSSPIVNPSEINKVLNSESESFREEVIQKLLQFSRNCARVCYTAKSFEELNNEKYEPKFVQDLVNSGHHSVFEHINFTFNMEGIPKIVAMTLNNEQLYATSEKSARYTIMEDMAPEQKNLFNKWMSILIPEIDAIYPEMINQKKRRIDIKRLAQENARYMTSIFTPVKMEHTINWRQLNFILQEMNNFSGTNCSEDLTKRLSPKYAEFYNILKPLKISGLENQTDKHLSLFGKRKVEEHFGDVYSTKYLTSFATLAQAQRHRTINYHISDGTQLKASYGFYIPAIIKGKDLESEWKNDLESIAKYDFPQAQLIQVNERGIIEDFRSKTILRICGQVQPEVMENTIQTAKKYKQFQEEFGENALNPKCQQGMKCSKPCIWGGKRATTRLI